MKIKKYQSGGIYYTPYFRDSAGESSSPAVVSQPTSSTNKEDQLIQKEIVNVLKENGLPNDVDYFLSMANSFLNKAKNFGNLFSTGQPSSYDMSDLIRIQSLANRIRHNNELHTNAVTQVKNEKAGSEIALSNDGQMYVVTDEGLKTVAASTYYNNPEKYQVLTNSQLIHLREEQPELAYNGSILTDLTNAVGMESIINYVKNTIGAFGTEQSQNKFDRYTTKYKNRIEQGFEQLLGIGPDGYYKVSTDEKISNQGYNDQESLQLAVNYLYKTLPQNMRNVLKAQAAAEGLNPNKAEDVQHLLTTAIVKHTDHSIASDISLNYDATASKAASGSGTGSDKPVEKTYLEMVATGAVSDPRFATISSSQQKGGIEVITQDYPMLDKTGKKVAQNTLKTVLNEAEVGNLVDRNSIFIGDQRISDIDLNRIVWDGTSSLSRMWLPKDKVAESQGIYKPDLDAWSRYEKFNDWVESNYGVTAQSIQAKQQELDLDLVYDEITNTWIFKPEDTMVFFGLSGYVSDKAVDINNDSQWLQHVDGPDNGRLFDIYSTYVNYGGEVAKKSDKRTDKFKGGWFGIGDKSSLYKGMIFMPMHDSKLATVATNHELANSSDYRDILNQAKLKRQRQSIKTNF